MARGFHIFQSSHLSIFEPFLSVADRSPKPGRKSRQGDITEQPSGEESSEERASRSDSSETTQSQITDSIDVLVANADELIFEKQQQRAVLLLMNVGEQRKAFKINKTEDFYVKPAEGYVEPGAILRLFVYRDSRPSETRMRTMSVEYCHDSSALDVLATRKTLKIRLKQNRPRNSVHDKKPSSIAVYPPKLHFGKGEQPRKLVLVNFADVKKAFMIYRNDGTPRFEEHSSAGFILRESFVIMNVIKNISKKPSAFMEIGFADTQHEENLTEKKDICATAIKIVKAARGAQTKKIPIQ